MPRRGLSLIELMAVLAILAVLVAGTALIARSFLGSARRSRGAAQVADALALARARAVAKSERWRVRVARDATSGLATSLLLQSCSAPISGPLNQCSTGWVDDPKGLLLFEPLTGVSLPAATVAFVFDRLGQSYRFDDASTSPASSDTTLVLCSTFGTTGACDGGPTRTITIRKYSGVLA